MSTNNILSAFYTFICPGVSPSYSDLAESFLASPSWWIFRPDNSLIPSCFLHLVLHCQRMPFLAILFPSDKCHELAFTWLWLKELHSFKWQWKVQIHILSFVLFDLISNMHFSAFLCLKGQELGFQSFYVLYWISASSSKVLDFSWV